MSQTRIVRPDAVGCGRKDRGVAHAIGASVCRSRATPTEAETYRPASCAPASCVDKGSTFVGTAMPRERPPSDIASRASSPHVPTRRFDEYMNSGGNAYRGNEMATKDSEALMLEKQSVLMDMERLRLQGIHFSKQWTIEDRVEDMRFEIRRHTLHVEEINNMNLMRDGLRMLCTGVEMLNGRLHLLDLTGWANETCSDMSKYDAALSKIYRKYWRRSKSSSPEMEIAMGMLTSMGMYHFKRGGGSVFPTPSVAPPQVSRRRRNKRSPAKSDTDSEGMPP